MRSTSIFALGLCRILSKRNCRFFEICWEIHCEAPPPSKNRAEETFWVIPHLRNQRDVIIYLEIFLFKIDPRTFASLAIIWFLKLGLANCCFVLIYHGERLSKTQYCFLQNLIFPCSRFCRILIFNYYNSTKAQMVEFWGMICPKTEDKFFPKLDVLRSKLI